MLLSGDVPGWGSLQGKLDLDIQQCAIECTNNHDCNSFEYVPNQQDGWKCNLNREASPTSPFYFDQMFCCKLGKPYHRDYI